MEQFLQFLPINDLIKEGWPSAESYFRFIATSQIKHSQDTLRDEMLSNTMKATTDSSHKIMGVINRTVDPIVRELGDLRSKQA